VLLVMLRLLLWLALALLLKVCLLTKAGKLRH
jgi:hypothetical protein